MIDRRLVAQLDALGLRPDRHLQFGRDSELPRQDTLEFTALDSWSLDLATEAWDPASLNSLWFELVNGAYGNVYRATALVNLPDGRGFLFNWMVSRSGTQFLRQLRRREGQPHPHGCERPVHGPPWGTVQRRALRRGGSPHGCGIWRGNGSCARVCPVAR